MPLHLLLHVDKSYGADYNAAAHLRRAHFYPRKDRRGDRTKANESRGGTGGGEEPPLSILMDWRYETDVLDTSIFDDDSNILH
jgi:hypothetical protein